MPSNLPFWDDGLAGSTPGVPDTPFGLSSWDTVTLSAPASAAGGGPFTLPGKCDVQVTRGTKIDVKSGAGSNGATLTGHGYDPAKISITLTMWTDNQWQLFQSFLALLEPPPEFRTDPTRRAFGILHPLTALRGVTGIVIEEIDGPHPKPGGLAECTIKCIEFMKPNDSVSVTSTPVTDTPINSLGNVADPTPQAPSETTSPDP